MFLKCVKVIDSCTTAKQMMSASKYTSLAYRAGLINELELETLTTHWSTKIFAVCPKQNLGRANKYYKTTPTQAKTSDKPDMETIEKFSRAAYKARKQTSGGDDTK